MHVLTFKGLNDTRLVVLVGTFLYLLIIRLFIGLSTENFIIALAYNIMVWLCQATRKFIFAFSIFVFFGILYDFLKVFPNYLLNDVDIAGIYSLEKTLFGFVYEGMKVTPNEYFTINHNSFSDIISSLFYINWIPVPLAFGIFLYYSNKRQYLHFALTFLLVNLIGFAGYYLHPTAPPWYIEYHGFVLDTSVGGNAAAFSRFDSLIGFQLFGSIYTRNSNIFAAIPSLHCAYPVIVLAYGMKNRLGRVNWFLVLFMLGIWFASVYSNHHYIVDVILGVLCAIAGILIFDRILMKTKPFKSFVSKYLALIS